MIKGGFAGTIANVMNVVLSVLDYLFAGSQNTPILSIKHLKHLNLFSFNVMGIKIYRFLNNS